ncbi:41191_t:CDS:2 [Gigaspora margarita]|uniref:41191_t:CDS:1 n=1 Tax=Gigaspora margarita TaxID=4874 RepID=A0ABM8W4W5_GIGMA|nr:41191_t:CDS:2 [Gigaspora margarita]
MEYANQTININITENDSNNINNANNIQMMDIDHTNIESEKGDNFKNILYNYEKNNESMDEGILPTRKPATIPTTVPTIRKAAHKRTLYEDEIININLQGVKNPNKVTGRGRPPKRRYLSSVEKEQSARGGSKTRGSYKCRVCQQVGHNAAFHKGTRSN